MVARRWLTRIGIGLLLVAALLAVLLNRGISLGFATPLIERLGQRYLHRELIIAQAPELRVGRELSLTLGGLALAGSPADAPLIELDSLELRLLTRSLLAPTLVINELTVSGLTATVAIDAKGDSNLPDLPGGRAGDAGSDDARLPVVLRQARFDELRLRVSDARAGRDVDLRIEQIAQTMDSPQASILTGNGTLQGKPWQLELNARSDEALAAARDSHARISASLADLSLTGELHVASLFSLAGAEGALQLQGSLPPAIADLSPLLDAGTPMALRAELRDTRPGVALDLTLDFESIDLDARGTIAEARSWDDIDLQLALNARSLNALLGTVGLAATDDLPVDASARLRRNGNHLRIDDLSVISGEHRLDAQANFPSFPDPVDASLNLRANGPDFAFYQRMLRRPARLEAPYETAINLVAHDDGPELLDSSLRIGTHRLQLQGPLGALPSLAGSDLRFALDGPDINDLASNVPLSLPSSAYHAEGHLSVDSEGRAQLHRLAMETLELTAEASGQLERFPTFDGLELDITLDTASLEALSRQFGLRPLGAQPAEAALHIAGRPGDLRLRDIRLQSPGLRVGTRAGNLRIRANQFESDLQLAVDLRNLPALLGAYATDGMPGTGIGFTLSPRLVDDRLQLTLDDFRGAGISGNVQIDVPRNRRPDATTRAQLSLQVASLAELIPGSATYQPPARPFSLRAATLPGTRSAALSFELASAGDELLSGTLSLPATADESYRVSLRGEGADLRVLGRVAGIPDTPLPYRLRSQVEATDDVVDIAIEALQLGDSALAGTLQVGAAGRELRADLTAERLDVKAWLPRRNSTPGEPAAAADGRLIPAAELPLALLEDYRVDLQLRSGPLGLTDPVFATRSLVDALQLRLRGGDGRAALDIVRLAGSRGELRGDASLTATDSGATAELSLQMSELPLALTLRGESIDDVPQHELRAYLNASGRTVRELAASLNGELLIEGGTGTLSRGNMRFATNSFFDQLFSALLPGADDRSRVNVECSVIAVRADNGVITLDPGIAYRSDDLDLTARGQINLVTEKLAIRFDNQARRGLGISAASLVNPYVQITGTLASPRLGLDLASSAVAGGAAIASGGLTVLAKPLFGRFLRRSNPCEIARERWQTQSEG